MLVESQSVTTGISNIKAYLNEQPPGPTRAWVTADVVLIGSVGEATLVKAVPQGINPSILLLEVERGPFSKDNVERVVSLRFDEDPSVADYSQVTINYNDESHSKGFELVQ